MLSLVRNLYNLGTQQDKAEMIRATLLKAIESFFTSAPVIFLYLILLELFKGSINRQTVIDLTLGMVSCIVFQFIFGYFAYGAYGTIQSRVVGRIHNQIGEHLRKLSMGFFSSTNVGDINAVVTTDLAKIDYMYALPTTIDAIAVPSFVALLLFFVDWRMALATVAGIPLAMGIYRWSQSQLRQLTQFQAQSQIEANSRTIEYIQGMNVIRAFDQTGAQFSKFDRAIQHYRDTNINLATKLAPAEVAFDTTLELGFAVILVSGAYLLLQGQLTTPTFLMFLILSLRFYKPLQKIGDLSRHRQLVDTAIERISSVFNIKPLPEPEQSQTLKQFDIEFKNVSFSYEQKPVLQNVSFTVPERSMTALVGPSGAGKTTVINLIARFWDVDEGEILIGGVNVKDLKTDSLLSYISLVFQDVYLFNDTILNNIKFGNPDASEEQVFTAAKAARCHEFILEKPHGYHTIIGEGGATLSGGEKQRISIACAILKDAPIVLLDEATASIDPENELVIQQAIDSLVASKTLIIIAHKLSTIENAEQILVIDRGQIIEQGKHEDLITNNSLYSRFWAERQKARTWKIARR